MASVIGSVSGGDPKRVNDVETVQDVKDELGLEGNYTAAINGDTASLSDLVENEQYVTFATAVKGG